MSMRAEWVFNYLAEELAGAAADKAEHHRQRLEFWRGKQESVVEEIRSKGLDVSESIAAAEYGGLNATGLLRGARVVVKDEYQAQLNECHQKIVKHESKAKEYEAWAGALAANPNTALSLHMDDWVFFFQK